MYRLQPDLVWYKADERLYCSLTARRRRRVRRMDERCRCRAEWDGRAPSRLRASLARFGLVVVWLWALPL